MKMLFFISLTALFIGRASAIEPQDICFKETLPYFQNFSKIKASAAVKSEMLTTSCNELHDSEMTRGKSFSEAAYHKIGNFMAFGLAGHGASAFSKLNGSAKQKEFLTQLNVIKKNPDPMDRIRQVYQLVVETQGKYDYDSEGHKNMSSGFFIFTEAPGNIINNAEKRGTGGVCRDFASLLQWSLLQVSRYEGSKSSALGESDFSSDFISGTVPEGGHAWVRVNMPQFNKGRITGFNTFDLDTTWYQTFSPLFPRNSGLSQANREKAINQCHQISQCLSKKIYADDIDSTTSATTTTTLYPGQMLPCYPGYIFSSGNCVKSRPSDGAR